MRMILFLAALAVPAVPAAAQVTEREARAADRLADPLNQEIAAASIAAVVSTILDTRVGALAQWSDGAIRSDDTLRDVKRRDDPEFERRFYADTRRTTAHLGAAASDLVTMLGEVRRTAKRLEGLGAAAGATYVDGSPREP